ncbi:DUF211 domain-containing protein [Haloarchaeobius sp. HME9146]|uniref:DUF211 domain-containing protein n=1 Tax=Haloarchaeobius sp. HME9146 TaxID=2978732 RepID=UPI0021BE0526|nr:DUF211 domain-containing protein [Haloarchaeobius sp. HME9146]MCT9094483.1 DUF211 domain-containing protein [Haloarchaeobius sp. HME9146]
MPPIRRLVLDVLKPHDPNAVRYARGVGGLDGVEGVNVVLVETDRQVETVKLTVEGPDISFETVRERVEDLGGSVHSIDEVVCGEQLVEQSETPQD